MQTVTMQVMWMTERAHQDMCSCLDEEPYLGLLRNSPSSLSTTEAEFVAAANGACQAVWLRIVLEQIGFAQRGGTTLFCDNSSTIKLSKNPVMHGRSKHIHVRYHFLRDLVNDGIIDLEYCSTQMQLSYIMTKAVKLEVFEKVRGDMGICSKEE